MDIFPIPAGERFIDLVEDSSQSSTESGEIENDIELDEEISPELTPTVLSFEVESSSDDVEITDVKLPDPVEKVQIPEKIPQVILPFELEIEKMKQEVTPTCS